MRLLYAHKKVMVASGQGTIVPFRRSFTWHSTLSTASLPRSFMMLGSAPSWSKSVGKALLFLVRAGSDLMGIKSSDLSTTTCKLPLGLVPLRKGIAKYLAHNFCSQVVCCGNSCKD